MALFRDGSDLFRRFRENPLVSGFTRFFQPYDEEEERRRREEERRKEEELARRQQESIKEFERKYIAEPVKKLEEKFKPRREEVKEKAKELFAEAPKVKEPPVKERVDEKLFREPTKIAAPSAVPTLEWQRKPTYEKLAPFEEALEVTAVPALRKFYPSAFLLSEIEKRVPGAKWAEPEDIRKRAPVASTLAEMVADIGNLINIHLITGGIAPAVSAKIPGYLKTSMPYISRLLPAAVERMSQWGIKGLVDKLVDQYRAGKFVPSELGEAGLKEAPFGLVTAGSAVIEQTVPRILATGILRGTWATLQEYVDDKKIGSEDLLNIGANAVLGMVFEAINAPAVSKRIKETRLLELNREINIERMVGRGTPRADAEKINNLLEALSLGRLGRAIPAEIRLAPAWATLSTLPVNEQIRAADTIAQATSDAVKRGQPIFEALFSAIKKSGLPMVKAPGKKAAPPEKEETPIEVMKRFLPVKEVMKDVKPGKGEFKVGEVYFWEHPDPMFKEKYSKNVVVAGKETKGKIPVYAWTGPEGFMGLPPESAMPELTPLEELRVIPEEAKPPALKAVIPRPFVMPELDVAGMVKVPAEKVYTGPLATGKLETQEGLVNINPAEVKINRETLKPDRLERSAEAVRAYKPTEEPIHVIRTKTGELRVGPDGNHRIYAAQLMGIDSLPVKLSVETEVAEVAPTKRVTVAQIEKEMTEERMTSYLADSESQESYAKRVNEMANLLNKPEVRANRKRIKQVRTLANKELAKMTGMDILQGMRMRTEEWEAVLNMLEEDPNTMTAVKALREFLYKIDEVTGGRRSREKIMVAEKLGLPTEGKYFIPYGKYSTSGTGNREWVQQNIPLVYMGNKRGMVGYAMDALGITQKDLGNIVPADVKHLRKFKRVVDVFGGSGLLSNLSKKFFPKASITYNELDPGVVQAIEKAKTDPKVISRFVSEVAKWLHDKPDADWLAHFNTVYKGDPDFLAAARLIESTAGRTRELTPAKLENLLKAIPNFSKTFKGIKITQQDGFSVLDRFIESGTSSDFLWIDPPYLWSAGYTIGAEMERAEGFMKLLDKLERLEEKGVGFIFFNNDPEVQAAKAKLEAVHLNNITGRINQLSRDMIVVHGVKPIGTARRELLVTNLPYGKKEGRLLVQAEVEKAILKLRADPAAAPKEILKMYRDIRGTSEHAPEGQRISAHQIRTLRSLRKRLRIKNREMTPVLDELLGDTAFAKMTQEDGVKMIDWLQPRNWDVIENKIGLTREMLAEERRQKAVGERFVAKDTEIEDKFGVLSSMNETVDEIESLAGIVRNLPKVKKVKIGLRHFAARYLSPDLATDLLGVKNGFFTPLRAVINTGKKHQNRLWKPIKRMLADLSKEELFQVSYLQAGAKKYYGGKITDKAKRYANYLQEVSEANIEITNRLRLAVDKPALKPRKPYISFIVDEDLSMAANLFDRVKFWEQRTKTPKDFAVGLFEKDPNRIYKIWSKSCGSWLTKNLYGALLSEKLDTLYDASGASYNYVNELVMRDIYGMLPAGQKFVGSVAKGINERIGSIWPKKIPIDPELADAVLNTSFGKDLRENIKEGYLEVPRYQIPNLVTAFHMVFYPAKLAWNFGFGLVNRQQTWQALPFVGTMNWIKGRLRMYTTLFPWNRKVQKAYLEVLEKAGYEFGRTTMGEEIPRVEGKIGKVVDHLVHFINDVTEFMNRLEDTFQAEYFLGEVEKRVGKPIPPKIKKQISARFSGFINHLYGRGYSPIAQRSNTGRFLYTFQQYPINTLHVYNEMYKYAMKDEGAANFWKTMARESATPEEITELFDKLPPKSRGKVFLIALSLVMPVAVMYALSRSWNVASRALPGIPKPANSTLIEAVSSYLMEPDLEGMDKLINEWKSFTRVTARDRIEDVLNVYQTGVLQTRTTKRPMFIDSTKENLWNLFAFGRSSLEEYEKRYPTWLGRKIGGETDIGRVKKLESEREKIREQETEDAVRLLKLIQSDAPTDQVVKELSKMRDEGQLTKSMKDKLKTYMKEQALEKGSLERSIIDLKDEDQARFVLDKINSNLPTEELTKLLATYKRQGILTDNVRDEMRRITEEGYQPKKPGIFQRLFR